MFIAMNRFRVAKGAEAAFEQVWLSRDTALQMNALEMIGPWPHKKWGQCTDRRQYVLRGRPKAHLGEQQYFDTTVCSRAWS
jgi:heme-degrading monooxygenase HmoA